MKKRCIMTLYGAPGVGKSTFASKAPSPFFITTDSNYGWLDLPEEDHVQVKNWVQFKTTVDALIKEEAYKKYETIVVDLTEGLYRMCDEDFCKVNRINHVSDYKSMGAGYSRVREIFVKELTKLINNVDKHIILISHESILTESSRFAGDKLVFAPSSIINWEKGWSLIEGECRFFLRAYLKAEEINGKIVKKRYLSIVPKENEKGISRGIDESKVPEDIPLDWNEFAKVIGLDKEVKAKPVKEEAVTPVVEEKKVKTRVKKADVNTVTEVKEEVKEEVTENDLAQVLENNTAVKETPVELKEPEIKAVVQENVTPAPTTSTVDDEVRARIKAKLEAMRRK